MRIHEGAGHRGEAPGGQEEVRHSDARTASSRGAVQSDGGRGARGAAQDGEKGV